MRIHRFRRLIPRGCWQGRHLGRRWGDKDRTRALFDCALLKIDFPERRIKDNRAIATLATFETSEKAALEISEKLNPPWRILSGGTRSAPALAEKRDGRPHARFGFADRARNQRVRFDERRKRCSWERRTSV